MIFIFFLSFISAENSYQSCCCGRLKVNVAHHTKYNAICEVETLTDEAVVRY